MTGLTPPAKYGPAGEATPFYGSFHGKDEVRQWFADQQKYFHDDVFQIKELIAEGDKLVLTGVQQGSFDNGKHYDLNWVMVFVVKDGKITSYRGWEDTAQVVTQLK